MVRLDVGVPQALAISREQQRMLEAWIAARKTPQRVVFRSRMVLMAAEGKANRRIAQELQTSRPTVILWRAAVCRTRDNALTEYAPERGRKPGIPSQSYAEVQVQELLRNQYNLG